MTLFIRDSLEAASCRSRAREALDAEAFAVAHGHARAMGWRVAVELALSVGGDDSQDPAHRATSPR
jgi:hypothetical protein